MSDELDHTRHPGPDHDQQALPSVPVLPTLPTLPTLPVTAATSPIPPAEPDTTGGDAGVGGEDVPYLPPPVRPAPQPSAPLVFDAKAMVEATRRKVENPVYGHMPTGTPEGRAAAEAARVAMRRKRTRDKWIGRSLGVVLLGGIGAAGYVGYGAYQDDQAEREAEREAALEDTGVDAGDVVAPGPLGGQVAVIDALDAVNSGASPSAGGLMEAVDAAKEVVGQTNAQAGAGATPAACPALPATTLARTLATSGSSPTSTTTTLPGACP